MKLGANAHQVWTHVSLWSEKFREEELAAIWKPVLEDRVHADAESVLALP
jgi:hypothetical protein